MWIMTSTGWIMTPWRWVNVRQYREFRKTLFVCHFRVQNISGSEWRMKKKTPDRKNVRGIPHLTDRGFFFPRYTLILRYSNSEMIKTRFPKVSNQSMNQSVNQIFDTIALVSSTLVLLLPLWDSSAATYCFICLHSLVFFASPTLLIAYAGRNMRASGSARLTSCRQSQPLSERKRPFPKVSSWRRKGAYFFDEVFTATGLGRRLFHRTKNTRSVNFVAPLDRRKILHVHMTGQCFSGIKTPWTSSVRWVRILKDIFFLFPVFRLASRTPDTWSIVYIISSTYKQ